MRRYRHELFWGALTLLILVTVVGWSIYASYGWRLYDQWDRRADTIAARLNRSLSDTQLQLGVLAESLGSQLAQKNIEKASVVGNESLLKRLRISEVILHGPQESKTLYEKRPAVMPGIWRATVFDFHRTRSPQSALEITPYGARVLDIEPLKVGEQVYGIEAAIDLQVFLQDFARREGVELAFLVPGDCQRTGSQATPSVQIDKDRDYKILAASSPSAPEVISSLPLKKYIGQDARGIASLSKASAYAVLMLEDVEYRSSTVASVSSGSTLVIWADYSRNMAELTGQMRQTLYLVSIFVTLLGGLGIFIFFRLRRKIQLRLMSYRDAIRTANQSLRSEAAARQKIEERLRGIADEMYATRQNDLRLLSLLAHQLKLNASATIGFAEIINEANPQLKDKESLEALHQMGERIFLMGENIDLWSRRDTIFDRTHVHPQSLKAVVEQCIETLSPMAARKGIKFVSRLEDNLMVNADLLILQVAIKNLLSNAIKYSPHGGEVELHTRTSLGQVELAVVDHGQGIPPAVMEKLFEPDVEKLHRGTDGEEGLGLGLLIVRWAAKVHDIALRVTSDEGLGCRVTLTFAVPAGAKPHKA